MPLNNSQPYEVEGEVVVNLTDMDDDTLSISFTRSQRPDKPEDTVELRVYDMLGLGTVYFVAGEDMRDFIDTLQTAFEALRGLDANLPEETDTEAN